MSRLRWKLLVAMLAVVAVTVATSGLFTRKVTRQEMRKLRVAPRRPNVQPLVDHYRAHRSWNGVQEILDRMSGRFVLTNWNREVLAVSKDLRGNRITVGPDDRVTVKSPRGELVIQMPPLRLPLAYLYALPEKEPLEEFAALDRRLIVTFGAATFVAILLTLFLSRRITQPVEQLTVAADEMARGAIPAHVPVSGQDEIAQLARSFNAMSDALSRQQELRRRMVGDVAHELRTPLTNLRCELEAIEDGLVTADGNRVASLREEVQHLARLVDDLQELAVAEAGALQLHRERIDLGATVARVVESFGASRAVELNVEEVFVDADPMRIGQIVRNLLSNAFQHANERVSVTVTRDAHVSVADDGPGIPPSELSNIFERFYRLDDARSRQSGGAGLGLAIVKQLVELHGGRVWAGNRAEGGAVFTVDFS